MENKSASIPVIDLFAGPGGLGEGFWRYGVDHGGFFNIGLSIEKDIHAHDTLELRSFFRGFEPGCVPDEYYQFLQGGITKEALFEKFPQKAESAREHAWLAELGRVEEAAVDRRMRAAIGSAEKWVLIGGPPCQAYSTAGRSRNKGISDYVPEKDHRHFLYREYLRIIADHWPSVFVMENVRGILSSKISGELIFPKILKDLQDPSVVFNGKSNEKKYRYRIFSLTRFPHSLENGGFPSYNSIHDYTIECEKYGVPQARHRVILVGIREDLECGVLPTLSESWPVSVRRIIGRMPRLRSGFSSGEDSTERWLDWLKLCQKQKWFDELIEDPALIEVAEEILRTGEKLRKPRKGRGGEFVPGHCGVDHMPEWFLDERLGGMCNSTTRAHMDKDLYRYLYAACFTRVFGRSPVLLEFPDELLPEHRSASKATRSGNFADRFRVQASWRPSTTIMSHIAKDGHYYIHYDGTQCRSLTVREAARLQTFPDNYFFCGPRTHQYTQVGNAVPPFLAWQIAGAVHAVLGGLNEQKIHGHAYEGKTKLEYVPN